jgi:hypothetical protein
MGTTHKITLTEAEQFFYDHAGYSYRADHETKGSGRTRIAVLLADAEEARKRSGAEVQWEEDDDQWTARGDDEEGILWCAALVHEGHVLASLGAINFGPDKGPYSDPYARVVEAELAMEAMTIGHVVAATTTTTGAA